MHPFSTTERVRVYTATSPVTELLVPARAIVAPARVFRGDSRDPSEIFLTGFRVRSDFTNTDLKEYGLRNAPSPWLGCSRRAREAACFPQRSRGTTWVYEIESPGIGIEMNRVIGINYVFRHEQEIVFVHDVPPSRIVRAERWSWGTPTGRVAAHHLREQATVPHAT
ncbi:MULTISPECIES: hypothetical protein [Streptomyces]|uniref:Pierisin-like domain-containing protein n=1 Tax=Streptomyces rubrogriseus TaxID=194673 RepID=A0A6G3T789_9ACTN|nr:hypothetical protein [Streptomyces rubrogriseus]MYS70086.1 hypothetical protein [Streptomyces sp. SID5926]NEC32305.1 hypothetical protein [Streptomyces rubrogriseus]